MKRFDQQFGRGCLESIPSLPGIYQIYDDEKRLIYVGKAKNLRRRLGQYRNSKRCKRHQKMLRILKDACSFEVKICSSELEAELLEIRQIQEYRPKWNVAGAFSFLYPMIGIKFLGEVTQFCYTTQPFLFKDFYFHGAFRSRQTTREGFFALVEILKYMSHLNRRKKTPFEVLSKHNYVYEFRQLPAFPEKLWQDFWQGESKELLENLVLALTENADARSKPQKVQLLLKQLLLFWKKEALPLYRARQLTGYSAYPVSQKDRDLIFLQFKALCKYQVGGSHAGKF